MLFKNQNTGKEVNVSNLTIKNDRIFFSVRGKGCGARFLNRNTCLVLDEHVEDGTYLKTAEGWEVIKKKKAAASTPQPKPTPTPANEPAEAVEVVEEEPNEENAQEAENVHTNENADEQALIAAIKNLRGGAIDLAKVREIVAEEIAKLAATEPKKAATLKAKAKAAGKKEYFCKDFEKIKKSVELGFYPYLKGAAGCGKSHTAEQVARALGLDYFSQTTIQFAHDVRGYGDAGGNFQETPFFKAFANGGLYFQDEYDRSNPDASIVLNTALANGYYDFPVVGRVDMHPNFRFMAAGNTDMKGAQDGYVTGQEQDPSSRDRVFFVECTYNHEVELNAIAEGDADLVAFIEDVRRAVSICGIEHVVSYRATKFMHETECIWGKEGCLKQKTFAGLGVDEIREIYARLRHTDNIWAQAMKNLF